MRVVFASKAFPSSIRNLGNTLATSSLLRAKENREQGAEGMASTISWSAICRTVRALRLEEPPDVDAETPAKPLQRRDRHVDAAFLELLVVAGIVAGLLRDPLPRPAPADSQAPEGGSKPVAAVRRGWSPRRSVRAGSSTHDKKKANPFMGWLRRGT